MADDFDLLETASSEKSQEKVDVNSLIKIKKS